MCEALALPPFASRRPQRHRPVLYGGTRGTVLSIMTFRELAMGLPVQHFNPVYGGPRTTLFSPFINLGSYGDTRIQLRRESSEVFRRLVWSKCTVGGQTCRYSLF